MCETPSHHPVQLVGVSVNSTLMQGLSLSSEHSYNAISSHTKAYNVEGPKTALPNVYVRMMEYAY